MRFAVLAQLPVLGADACPAVLATAAAALLSSSAPGTTGSTDWATPATAWANFWMTCGFTAAVGAA